MDTPCRWGTPGAVAQSRRSEAGARGSAAISAPPNGERGPGSWAKHADLKRVFPILALERTTEGDVFVILGAPILSTEIKA